VKTQSKAKGITRRTKVICILAWFIPCLSKWLVSKLDYGQARAAFHSAVQFSWPRVTSVEGVKTKCWFTYFSPVWFTLFYRWLETCTSEGQVKGLFYEIKFWFGDNCDNPLKSAAIEKWLTFLTDWNNVDHRHWVYKLYHSWEISVSWRGFALLNSRREQFAASLLQNSVTADDDRMVIGFAKRRKSLGNSDNLLLDIATANLNYHLAEVRRLKREAMQE
jgi:hypothetical protein